MYNGCVGKRVGTAAQAKTDGFYRLINTTLGTSWFRGRNYDSFQVINSDSEGYISVRKKRTRAATLYKSDMREYASPS